MSLDDEMVGRVLSAIRYTFELTQGNKESLEHIDPSSEDSNNRTRRVDRLAQENLKIHLEAAFGRNNIAFVAEEPDEAHNRVPDDLCEKEVDVAILDSSRWNGPLGPRIWQLVHFNGNL